KAAGQGFGYGQSSFRGPQGLGPPDWWVEGASSTPTGSPRRLRGRVPPCSKRRSSHPLLSVGVALATGYQSTLGYAAPPTEPCWKQPYQHSRFCFTAWVLGGKAGRFGQNASSRIRFSPQ